MALTRPTAAQINSTSVDFNDPLIRLNKSQSGANDKDIGVVFERGSDANVALIWDESTDQFAVINTSETGSTSGNVDISSYANFRAGTITASLTGNVTGNASTASAWANARTITLGGVLSGNVSIDGSANVTLTAAHTSDPVITLTGDVTGSATMTNLGNVSITATVADDSHNHIISNIDGLQTALDAKAALSGATFTGDISGTNLTLSGNLTVSGNTTYVNTTTLNIGDNIITLNADESGTPSQNAGIEIERGTSSNVILQWNETSDYWEIASGGTTGRILTTGDEGAGNGLDADTLDSIQASSFLRSDTDDTLNATITIAAGKNLKYIDKNGTYPTTAGKFEWDLNNDYASIGAQQPASDQIDLTFLIRDNATTGTDRYVFHIDDYQGSSFDTYSAVMSGTVNYFMMGDNGSGGPDTANARLTIPKSGNVTVDGSRILTVADEGSGNGLDADTLDGQQGSYYLDWTNVTNKPDPVITLAGDLSGSVTLTDLASGTLTATLTKDPVITLTGDVTGSATMTNLGNVSITATVVDDSHNHIIGNIDGLQTALDSKLATSSYTASDVLSKILTVDGSGSGIDADKIDGIESVDLSRKVMQTANGNASDANYWAKIATYTITGNYNDGTFLYFFMNEESGVASSAAIVAISVRTNNVSTGQANSVSVSILGMHQTDPFNDNAFKLLDNGSGTAIELWVQKNSAYDSISVYEHSARMEGVSVAYNNNASWEASEPVGSGNNVRSAGLRYRGNAVWHSGNDGSGSGLDADTLDGQQGSYYLDWTNVTNKPDPVITLTGDVTGSGTMTDLGNVSITTTVAANSVALGTDTTGNYVATISGTSNEVTVSGSGSESASVTIGLPDDVTIGDTLTVTGNLFVDTNTLYVDATNNAVGIGTSSPNTYGKTVSSGDIATLGRGLLKFYDTDSSNYVALRAASTVSSNVTWTLPAADGTSGQVLGTDGAGNLSWTTGGGGGASSGFVNSTITTAPGAGGDYDLAEGPNQDGDETPFEATGTDAFGVSLGTVYDNMEPTGSIVTIDYGDGETYVGEP